MNEDPLCLTIEISRGTTHDGPGMRTTVFLKGCPLTCRWCQNPEGMKPGQEIWWEGRKCIRCLACVEACPRHNISPGEGDEFRPAFDHENCALCGECVEACPSQAMAFVGQEWTLEALVKEVLKDRDYYTAFGGGVTVSGGEPLAQVKFIAPFLRRLKEEGLHTALDTCGLASPDSLAAALPHADLVLFDIKLADPDLHRAYTGRDNRLIFANLGRVAQAARQSGGQKRVWIRTPLIPTATATEDNLAQIGAYIHANIEDAVDRWELCAFNPACKGKYQKMGQEYEFGEFPLMTQAEIERLKAAALSSGFDSGKLVISGLVARDAGNGSE